MNLYLLSTSIRIKLPRLYVDGHNNKMGDSEFLACPTIIIASSTYDESPVCDSPIYCHGELLRTIQMSGLFKDSKTFVDKKLKNAPGKVFLEENFDDEGLEIEASPPKDWSQVPPFTVNLKSAKLRGLAKRINRLWMKLNRKIISDVEERQSLYSIIYVPNNFVVPGGRFREFYYWDTYWIIKSLLHCGMTLTVREFITNRFLGKKTASVNVKYLGHEFMMFRYGTNGTGPRPESLKEDFELVSNAPDSDKERMYYDLKAGAESGWDYSSRWFISESGNISSDIIDIHTSSIIPVDLNCFMFLCYKNLSHFYTRLGNHEKAKEWIVKATCLRLAIHIVEFPTSLINSGQQWDFPNAWPPLQHILIVGLMNTGHTKWAQNLARLYTDSTMFSCSEDDDACKIFEKYSVVDRGTAGGGGEYEVQEGFGWTNGVIIDLIAMFRDDLLVDHSKEIEDPEPTKDDVIAVFDVSSGKSHPLRSNAWGKKLKRSTSQKRFNNIFTLFICDDISSPHGIPYMGFVEYCLIFISSIVFY
ncbi:TREH [Lepeophtheirus salmonis]|uniref:Trehalase n=1 Tax=Lepeophtheirus salmonis TaxID=72036 RepID=A0A7R8CW06_LEPSM|nr:TREH [Lepeophtheirus salmonis]CAF2917500.1 TREH [Lepeophtheirus salmonis]